MENALPLQFTASAIVGAGRGKQMGVPTINVNLASVPESLEDGIYACYVLLNEGSQRERGAMHYGPRPVFDDTRACEVHLLDKNLEEPPHSVTITVIQRLREVRDFPSTDALVEQIRQDVEQCKDILRG